MSDSDNPATPDSKIHTEAPENEDEALNTVDDDSTTDGVAEAGGSAGDSDDTDDDGEHSDAAAAAVSGGASADEELPTGRVADYVSDRAFQEFPLSPEVLQGITEIGYRVATQVQAITIEPALAGKNLVVRSKTGTGKTAAFCIPLVEAIPAGARTTQAIVLTPTRELARQVADEAAALAKFKDLRVAVIYGGVGFGQQEEALREGAEIVVGTPGRMLDHLRRGNLDLSGARFAVLDEADEMLSMGFFEDVSKLLEATPEDRQCLFFSATVDDRVRHLISRYAKDADDVRLSTDADKVEGIAHVLYETTPDFHKARALLAIIDQEEPSSAIIFCNTREDTATVASFLSRQGLDAELISGELPQNKREQVMARVKRGETQYLVATDVAARGIDISDLSHVINYSLPEDPAVYLHRTGRTGRIGKKGIAISLAGGTDMGTRGVLERQYEINFEQRPLPTAEEAAAARVERISKYIRDAMGTMAFEGYIGTVRALKDRPDGDFLLAACLRAFVLWDRMRRAAAEGAPDSITAVHEAREERRQERQERRGGSRDGRRGGGRDDRRGGRSRDDRRDGRSSRPSRSRDGEPQSTEPAAKASAPAAADSGPPSQDAGAADESRKRRRRRRRGPREGGAGDSGGSDGSSSSGGSGGGES